MSPAHLYYEEKITGYTARIQVLQKQLTLISLLRLISFLGLAITGYYLFKAFYLPLLYGALFFLVCFIALVIFNLRLKDQKALSEKLLFVNTNESGILNDQLNGFPDGEAFLKAESYLDDLDIFGRRSLVHLLNRTISMPCTQQLADLLRKPLLSKDTIKQHHQPLKFLTPQPHTRP